MSEWIKEELGKIANSDDLHISPFRVMEKLAVHRPGSGLL